MGRSTQGLTSGVRKTGRVREVGGEGSPHAHAHTHTHPHTHTLTHSHTHTHTHTHTRTQRHTDSQRKLEEMVGARESRQLSLALNESEIIAAGIALC